MKQKCYTQLYDKFTGIFINPFRNCFIISGVFIGAFLINSCEDFVEVELPSSQLNTEDVFTDKASAHAAMTAIYAQMRDGGVVSDLSYYLGLYSDELDLYGSGTTDAEKFYQNTLLPSDRKISSWWQGAYFLIYSSNSIIENIENATELSKEDIDQIHGEALFVRPLLHYNLSLLYGPIPYVKNTDYKEYGQTLRSPESEILDLVEQDLLEAISLLPVNYLNFDRTRPNKAVAMALLSRVYLNNKDWAKAEKMATAVIEQTNMYSWEDNLDNVFLKESKSTLWQWYPKFDGNNTADGNLFIFTSVPPNNVALTQSLIESFDTNDKRLSKWVRGVSNEENTWSHPFKYKEKGSTQPTREYYILFRLAELYLIRSEARTYLENLGGAASDLNKVRQRAGLLPVESIDKETLVNLIMLERQHELFTESGHRFFDLKRSQSLDNELLPLKSGWDTTDRLLPIPEEELLLNSNLQPQNPGY